jgi:type VI secretion system protein ImpH
MASGSGENFTHLIKDLQLCEKLIGQKKPQVDIERMEQDGLNFRPFENYVFPPSDIRSVQHNDEHIEFVLNFLGLYGINSPLPRCYHEQVAIQQEVHGSGNIPLQNFLDIFSNRFYWLYYQAWKKYRYYLQLSENPKNITMQRLFAFIGTQPEENAQKTLIQPFKLMKLSGLLSNRIRNKSGLLMLLRSFFPSINIDIQEFVPHMVSLSDLSCIGTKENPLRLGENSILGHSVLDCMHRICLTIGPISFDEYMEFSTEGAKRELLNKLLPLYLSDNIEYDVNFIIDTKDIRKLTCGDSKLKLGRNMWLGKPTSQTVSIYKQFESITELN